LQLLTLQTFNLIKFYINKTVFQQKKSPSYCV